VVFMAEIKVTVVCCKWSVGSEDAISILKNEVCRLSDFTAGINLTTNYNPLTTNNLQQTLSILAHLN